MKDKDLCAICLIKMRKTSFIRRSSKMHSLQSHRLGEEKNRVFESGKR